MSGYRLSYLEDGLLLGAGGPWAWLRLPTHPYEVLSEAQRLALLAREERLLSGLKEAEGHLLVLPRRYPAQRWARELNARTLRPTAGWPGYLGRVSERLAGASLVQREVYLGLKLSEPRRRGWLAALFGGAERLSGLEDPRPEPRRLAALRQQLDLLRRRLAAARPGTRLATAAELRWLVQRAQARELAADVEAPSRPAWGGEALALVDGAVIQNGRRWLRLESDAGGISYLCTLALAYMPELLAFPGGAEWLYGYELLGFPVEASVRFRVVPPGEAARDLGRQVLAAQDQAEHVAKAEAELPLEVEETYERARQLQRELVKGQQPLLYCWPRLQVTAADERTLLERGMELGERYRDLGLELVRPTGEQLSLFLEALPGDRLRVQAYEQRMPAATLAGAMYCASSELGDGLGPYLGQTTGVSARVVNFDPLRAATVNRATVVSLTGAPGSGKTTTALLLTYQARLRGAWCVLVDPKAEATGLSRLPGLGLVQRVCLDQSYEGLLDPFRIEADVAEASLLAADLCRTLLPVRLAREAEAQLLSAAAAEAEAEAPSLYGLLERLGGSANERGREAAEALHAIARLPLARICFGGEGSQPPLRLEQALTIFQFADLKRPEPGRAPEDYKIEERLGVGLMQALTALALKLLSAGPRSQPKLLVLDEAWMVTSSAEGQRLVERFSRTGRSYNAALLLVSQVVRDLLDETIRNCLSARFGFRSQDEAEIRSLLVLLEVEPTPEHLELVRSFQDGECLFSDLERRVGSLQVDLVLPELRAAFDTTPRPLELAPLGAAAEGVQP